MRKKKACLLCLYTTGFVLVVLAALGVVLKHEPHFYHDSLIGPGEERKRLSTQFVGKFLQTGANVIGRDVWDFDIKQAEINSFLQEDFVTAGKGDAENLRKVGVADPRIVFEDDRIRLAFRYGSGFCSTVVSYEMKVWAVPKEPNVLAVEIISRRAGGLPLSSQSFLDGLKDLATRHNIEITTYRHEGHPVALIRLQADQPRPTAHFKCLRVEPEHLRVTGSAACPNRGKDGKDAMPPAP
jgi:hypothetical protein